MSAPIDDGGPAFPNDSVTGTLKTADGMSLRDWFAGQALAGEMDVGRVKEGGDIAAAAELAYMLADAMIAARKAK